ncbi:unnamed protein product [Plutella xylostella]|uniref:(diamondback moth) hypothetical protein n=1 Tax=Plutella xylostella TaxID=51655 RepID=A0A8S4G6D6_PLUXY|nr:unnamed protein product [Plutella xylostella]
MDCCGYSGAGGWAGWGGWGAAPAHSHQYYDPYARYYRCDYAAPPHATHPDHAMQMDYGTYSSKEMRVRRAIARRDARARTNHHVPLPPTPPLDCGMSGRGPGYCEPPMWHYYQMGMMNGNGWGGGGWSSPALSCAREQMRYTPDFRSIKGSYPHPPSLGYGDGRSTPYSMYEDQYSGEACMRAAAEAPAVAPRVDPRPPPPAEKPRPAVVPLPAFQQAFGSTERGKFAEAFSRTESALEDAADFDFDWDAPEPQWSQPAPREIKCEDTTY